MKKFGIILNHFRVKSNISMAELAKDICSKHYVYLIEHEQRIPSVKMIDSLSAKLNFDWRDYVDFAENPSPVDAKELMDKFDNLSKNYDYKGLSSLLKDLPDEEWVKSYPMDIEIVLQKITLYLFCDEDYFICCEDTIEQFKEIVRPLLNEANFSFLPLISLRALHLYCLVLIKEKKIQDAFNHLKSLYASIQEKADIARYYNVYIDITHGLLKCYSLNKNYKMMNSLAIRLLNYQEDKRLLSEVPATLIIIGDSYKYIGKKTLAYRFYKRASTISKIIKNNYLLEKSKKQISNLY